MKIIIFGTKDLAQLAHFYFETDTPHPVVAFSVSKDYMPESKEFCELPVYPFETIETILSPDDHVFFAPMTGSKMNINRETIYNAIKAKGYKCASYVSSKATNFASSIGENCFILEDNTIQPFVQIGNNVIIWSGCHLGHHGDIRDHVFLTSHVVVSGHCIINSYSWIGVNSTIRDSLIIAEGTLIAMGACLTKNTEQWSVYMGLPAKKIEGKLSLEMNP